MSDFPRPEPEPPTRQVVAVQACWRMEGTEHAECATATTLADARRIIERMRVRHAHKDAFAVDVEIHQLRREGTGWRLEHTEHPGAAEPGTGNPDRHLAAARATLRGQQ